MWTGFSRSVIRAVIGWTSRVEAEFNSAQLASSQSPRGFASHAARYAWSSVSLRWTVPTCNRPAMVRISEFYEFLPNRPNESVSRVCTKTEDAAGGAISI